LTPGSFCPTIPVMNGIPVGPAKHMQLIPDEYPV
jgi:hypothetical protein